MSCPVEKLLVGLLCLGLLPLRAAEPIPEEEIPLCCTSYFAPISSIGVWRMRTPKGAIREFEPTGRADRLVSCDGWTAVLDGSKAVVRTPRGEKPSLVFHFDLGTLVALDIDGRHCAFRYKDPVVYDDEEIVPLWPEEDEVDMDAFIDDNRMWKGQVRLKLWFEGPNQAGAFLSFLFLIAAALAFRARHAIPRVEWILLALIILQLVLMTASRGALVATAVAFGTLAVCHYRRWAARSWRLVVPVLAGFALIVGIGFVLVYHSGVRNAESDRRSNQPRIEMWRMAPRMMCDAPWGWTSRREAARAYTDWYSADHDRMHWFNLVSDHLTVVTASGWLRGGLYLLAWFAGALFLVLLAFRGGSPLPAALWISLGISALFNVILFVKGMIWLPVASLALVFFDRRLLSRRLLAWSGGAGFLLMAIVLGAVFCYGSSIRTRPSLAWRSAGVAVNDDKPAVWVVDDKVSAGGLATPREIRNFYKENPQAAAIGYATELGDVPKRGVRRLVLVGENCTYYLRANYKDGFAKGVPAEIVFLSPEFPPDQIPPELLSKAKVSVVIGEFALRYYGGAGNLPSWVTVVKGAEVYLPGWMYYALRQF